MTATPTVADDKTSHGGVDERLARARGFVQAARFDAAQRELNELLEQGLPAYYEAEALYALAVVHRYQKDLSGALEVLDRLTRLRPDYGRAFQEAGHNYLSANRLDDAAGAFAQAVQLNPGLLPSWKALANLHEKAGRRDGVRLAKAQVAYLEELPRPLLHAIDLLHEGRLLKAEQLCRDFLQNNKQHIEGMRLLAEIGMRLKVYDDAEFLLESCVEFAPEHLGARSDYLKVLNRKGKFAQAYEQAQILHRSQPENPTCQLAMANALTGLGRLDEGIARYRASLDNSANKPGVHVMLGHALKAEGTLDEAIASYREAYRLKPDYGDAYWSLANTKTYRFSDKEVEQIKRQAALDGVTEEDRAHLLFAAGKALEDRGDYPASFEYYRKGNELQRQRSGYDPDKTTAMIDAQIQQCRANLFEQRGDLGFECADPIFIVGLPRAGSTLLEQILASHSMVDGTMELHNILGLAQRLRGRSAERSSRYPQILWELKDSYFRRFGEQFIDDTRVYRGNAPRFIDKMPNNFMHIGLIRLILPNAKIIDARRHPLACCFSGYKQLFGEGQDFTYGLEAIGRYYKDYVRLMDHWDAVLPGFVLRVMHEDVVDDLEAQVQRILKFCELPFEQACVEFHKTKRSVRTPSSEQVRQPIYRSGLEQWRNYEPWLGPLKEALGPDVRERFDLA